VSVASKIRLRYFRLQLAGRCLALLLMLPHCWFSPFRLKTPDSVRGFSFVRAEVLESRRIASFRWAQQVKFQLRKTVIAASTTPNTTLRNSRDG